MWFYAINIYDWFLSTLEHFPSCQLIKIYAIKRGEDGRFERHLPFDFTSYFNLNDYSFSPIHNNGQYFTVKKEYQI